MLRLAAAPITLALGICLLAATPSHAGNTNSLMDLTPDGGRLLVANSDNGSVTVVDTKDRKALREIKVGDKPEGVTFIGAGPLAAVTVYREDAVVILNTETGETVKRLTVPDEPYGIVSDKAGSKAWVTHDYPGQVSEIDLKDYKIVRTIDVAPFVRGIALANDEKRIYVAGWHTAHLYAVDLAQGKVVDTWEGTSKDNLCRQVLLHPTRAKAYLPHLRSKTEIADGSGSIFPQVSFCDLDKPASDDRRRRNKAMDTFNNLGVPTNPWEVAMSPDGKRFYVIYAGTNDMNLCTVFDDDYQEIERIGGFNRLGTNPRAIRLSPDGNTVYVSNTLDFEVGVYSASMQSQAKIKVCDPPKTPEWVRGKVLFTTANPPLTRARWIACSSCHPDGQHDGRTWQNPEGLRRTTALFGMAHTHPLHWSADRDESQDFEYTIRGRLMQGQGLLRGAIKPKQGFTPTELEEKLSGRSQDLDALAIYCNSFEYTLSPHIPAPGKLSVEAERGKALFFSKETNCASCHSGPYFSDSSLQKPFKLHDVGTGGDDKSEKMGPKYDTPSLLGVYRQTAWLHHGKAKSLHEVLTTCNAGDKHGKTSHLKPADIDDLVAFLKSLPYETPPGETANTVKDRVVPKKE